jgi:DNA helicase-2/ATP-dependent DNA helicase PcrA
MIHLHESRLDSDSEIERVVTNLSRWLPAHQDWTVAVLGHRNDRAVDFITALRQKGIETVDLTKVSFDTRKTAGLLAVALKYLADASSSNKLAELYHTIRSVAAFTPQQKEFIQSITSLLKKIPRVEDYLWPRPGVEWQPVLPDRFPANEIHQELTWFAGLLRRWQKASTLPPDQLLLTISADLLSAPADLALAHKLALILETNAFSQPEYGLPEFATLLAEIASERSAYKLTGFQAEETGFDPQQYKGKVVVSTLHKAKGLEWDRVYLTSINDYDFPSGSPGDKFMSEKWYIRSRLNLEAETLSRLEALARGDPLAGMVEEGSATFTARQEYSAERLRLLYVGLTRARREVIITWNDGRNKDCQPAVGFRVLQQANEERLNDLAE